MFTTIPVGRETLGPMRFPESSIDQYFPFDNYREGQREAIEFAARAFNAGKDIVIIEAPTGSGKSAIGWTLMDMVQKSYYLTITKLLQDQLVTEFGDQLVELKGRGSYPCTWWDRHGPRQVAHKVMTPEQLRAILDGAPNCAEGYCRTDCPTSDRITQHKCKQCFPRSEDGSDKKSGTLRVLPPGMLYSACPYYEQVYRAIASSKVVMNFSSFLHQTQMTNRFDEPRQLMVLDECFHPHTMVETELGRLPIGKIVNDRMPVRVLSYNQDTGETEYQYIERWLRRDKQMTYRVLAGNKVMYPTMDHKIYTVDGQKKLSELKIGDKVLVHETEITEDQRQVVLGSLLGAAAVHVVESKRISKKYPNKGPRARVRFRHGPKQADYVAWKHHILRAHTKSEPEVRPSRGFTRTTVSFSTNCNFYDDVAVVVVDGKKTPNAEWLSQITQLGLAVWYMDGGGLSNGSACFSTHGFTREENEVLAAWLRERWGLGCSVRDTVKRGKILHYIALGRESTRLLADLIARYIPPFMRHKLPEWQPFDPVTGTVTGPKSHRSPERELADELGRSMLTSIGLATRPEGWHAYSADVECQSPGPVTQRPVRLIEPYREAITYDLEVRNNRNYFAGATLVSNCHQVESVLLGFISLTMDDRLLQRAGLRLPQFETALEYAIWFADNRVDLVLGELYRQCKTQLDQTPDTRGRAELVRRQEDLSRLLYKLREFMRQISGEGTGEWVCETQDVHAGRNHWRKLVLKPVLVHNFVYDLLFRRARKVLMMSATVLNVGIVCESLGIDRSRVASYRMKNRFPVELRPIYLEPCGRISGGKSKMPEWGPGLVRKVDEVVQRYPGQRGIVHTHSFAIAELLMEGCRPEVRDRFAYQRRFRDKTNMLQHHAERQDSIIVAPAMHEGLNLTGDLSRLQIICKVPYPNFHEDKQLARRMEIDGRYLDWLTALKLVQSYGRSIRSEQDWADTYILDGTIQFFLHKAGSMLPGWFLEAIRGYK